MDHSFCEEHLLGLPEYYNSISSLFIVFFGVYGLMNVRNDLFIDILFASLAIVGVGSTGYHWYGNIGWALFDEIPMIITVFSGIIYTDNVYFLTYTNKYIRENSDTDLTTSSVRSRTVSMTESGLEMIKQDKKWTSTQLYNKKYRLLCYLFGMYVFMISNVMSDYRLMFPELFTCVVVYLYYKIYKLIQLLDISFQSQIKNKSINSLLTISISGAIWAGTEITCKHVNNHILLLGHPMWHFFIGHGFYNLIQIVYFIKLHDENYKIKYNPIYLLQIYPESFNRISDSK